MLKLSNQLLIHNFVNLLLTKGQLALKDINGYDKLDKNNADVIISLTHFISKEVENAVYNRKPTNQVQIKYSDANKLDIARIVVDVINSSLENGMMTDDDKEKLYDNVNSIILNTPKLLKRQIDKNYWYKRLKYFFLKKSH